MAYAQETIHTLYKKLLRFYPREFRERLGESMEQTFNDLYKERKTEYGGSGFVLWMFVETAIGIVREHILQITQGDPMKNILANLRLPAVISLLLVIPFMIMEVINRRNFNEGFPILLFVIMWLLPTLFTITVTPIVRNLRMGNSVLVNPVTLVLRVVFLAFLAWVWFGAVIDQMPCFLGVPNCD